MEIENQIRTLDEDFLNENFLQKNPNVEVQQIISLNKFIFLSIVSFGTYEFWWIYKSWRFFKQKEKLDIMPAGRAIFSIFFLRSLFDKILYFAEKKGYYNYYSSISLFVGFFFANLLSKLDDPFWLISIFSFAFLIPPFKALNFAKQNSDDLIVNEQTSFNTRQIVLIIIGIIFWCLVLLGLYTEKYN